jgi:3'-phosphoadenosine 5'-phosphosulfate sulfotransferase (PAPS reductase)/FAD synthetase
MLGFMADLIQKQNYPLENVIAVHCDLGRVEWPGTLELARIQANHYGFDFRTVSRPQGDLLDQIEARGMFPSSTARYCTSDQKTAQVAKLIRAERKKRNDCDVLSCLGIRAAESHARAKKSELQTIKKLQTKKSTVTQWYPIFHWSDSAVWTFIRNSGVPYHPAYDLGMSRLSCCFCILASDKDLKIAAENNPGLYQEYIALEKRINHTFRAKKSLKIIVEGD